MTSEEQEVDCATSTSKASKFLIGAFWIPISVVSVIIGMPVLGALAVQNKVSKKVKLDKYKRDPDRYLQKRSKKFLVSLQDKDVRSYAELQMKRTTELLTKYARSIPVVIQVKWQTFSKLYADSQRREQQRELYTQIHLKSLEMKKQIIPLGIKLCPAIVSVYNLDWKKEKNSCLGEGDFSLVYRGKLKNISLDLAVKVFKQPFDYTNLSWYLDHEEELRYETR